MCENVQVFSSFSGRHLH